MTHELPSKIAEIVESDGFAGRGHIEILLRKQRLRSENPSLDAPRRNRPAHRSRKDAGEVACRVVKGPSHIAKAYLLRIVAVDELYDSSHNRCLPLAAGIYHRPCVVVVDFTVRDHSAGYSRHRTRVGFNEHDHVAMLAVPREPG